MSENQQPYILHIKVIPGAAQNKIVGWEGDTLKLRIQAAPEKGQANQALVQFLAHTLKMAKSQFNIISGQTSRHKKIAIHPPFSAEHQLFLQTIN